MKHDPLDAWPAFAVRVRQRLEAGRAAYGDTSFSRDPVELLNELQQEALDLAGWGFVLFRRIEAAQLALQHVPGVAGDRDTLPAPEPLAGHPARATRLVGAARGR